MSLRLLYNSSLLVLIISFLYVWAKLILLGVMRRETRNKGDLPSLRFPFIGVSLFVVSVISVGYLHHTAAVNGREKLLTNLNGLAGAYRLRINGQDVQNADTVIAALKEIEDVPAHHSYPTKFIQIEVESEGRGFHLTLGRDSERASEYWVYSPADDFTMGATTGREVGRITTAAFDGY